MVSYCLIILLWSGVGGQLLSHHVAVVNVWWSAIFSHQIAVVRGWWSAIVSSDCCGQGLVVAIVPSDCCGQGLVVSYCLIMLLWSGVGGHLLSHQIAAVRGWWSAIIGSSCCCGQGVGGHLFSSHCCGQGLVVTYSHQIAVVRGWWSAIVSSCWWSILHKFFRRTLSRSFQEHPIRP